MVKGEWGFTLIEMLIVIGVMAILIGIGALSYTNMQQRYNVERQVKQMYTELMNARLRAVQRDRMHFVTFPTLTSTSYSVYEDGPPPDGDGLFTTATDSLVSQNVLLASYSAVLSNASLTLVQFTSKGLLSASTPTGYIRITPTAGGEYDCVFIDQIKTGMGQWNGVQCIIK